MSVVPATELLRIDIDAAVASLGTELVHGPWQIPTELVRLAVRVGADEVRLTLGRRGFRLAASGAIDLVKELDLVAIAVDSTALSADRQRAVEQLERAGAVALLWAAMTPGSRFGAALPAGTGWEIGRGRAVRRRNRSADDGLGELVLTLAAARWQQRRARAWLAACCRFASVPVTLDGVDLGRGFRRSGFALRVREPLPAALLVGAEGEAPTLWLLQHGIVSTRATIPRFPPFEAALEIGGLVSGPATPAVLRSAVTPALGELVEVAVDAMLRLAVRTEGIAPEIRARLVAALLVAARRRVRAEQITTTAFVPWVETGRSSLVSPAWLVARAATTAGAIAAADRDDGVAMVPHVRLGPGERADLEAVTGVVCRAVPAPLPLLRRRWRGWRQRAGAVVAATLARRRGVALARVALSEAERHFLDQLETWWRARGGDRGLGLHRGRRGRRRGAHGELLLPRRDPAVERAVAAVAADGRWLAIAARALIGDLAVASADA